MTWDACTMEPNIWLRWIECHQGTMSMVQGVGTFLAILAAVVIPVIIRGREEQFEQRSYERSLVAVLDAVDDVLSHLHAHVAKKEESLSDGYHKAIIQRCARQLEALLETLNDTRRDHLLKAHAQATIPLLRNRLDEFNSTLGQIWSDLATSDQEARRKYCFEIDLVRSQIRSMQNRITAPTRLRWLWVRIKKVARWIKA